MADTAEQARVREALRARGEALAPRVTQGGPLPRPTTGTAANRAARTGPRRASSTTRRTSGTGARTTPPTPGADDIGPLGGRRSSRTQPPTPGERVQRAVIAGAGKQWRAVPRVLVVEWIAALVIVATKPYEPADNTGKASEATIPQLIAVSVVYFLLAALASMSPKAQRIANLFGGLVDLALLLRNHGTVTSAITTVAKYQAPQAPNIAPSPAPGESVSTATTPGPGGILPTPTGQPSAAQQYVSGWRGTVPESSSPSGNAQPTPQPAPGG